MVEKVSVAKAKARLSDLLGQVAYGNKRFIIEKRGRPLAALVSVQDLEALERTHPASGTPHWALALAGAWAELEDAEIDSLISQIYARREEDKGRPVEFED